MVDGEPRLLAGDTGAPTVIGPPVLNMPGRDPPLVRVPPQLCADSTGPGLGQGREPKGQIAQGHIELLAPIVHEEPGLLAEDGPLIQIGPAEQEIDKALAAPIDGPAAGPFELHAAVETVAPQPWVRSVPSLPQLTPTRRVNWVRML